MDTDLKRFEQELERLSPGSLPEGLIARMEAAMEGWEEGGENQSAQGIADGDKVVPFPGREEKQRDGRSGSSLWAAAAGVAVLGALTGVFFTSRLDREAKSEVVEQASPVWGDQVQPVDFSPQVAKRKLLGASEKRVVMADGAQPLQMMRLDYIDRVVFRNAQGEEVHVEVPTVSYRLVPIVTD